MQKNNVAEQNYRKGIPMDKNLNCNAGKTKEKNEIDRIYSSIHGDKKYVFGEGNEYSGIVFIGEAPGADEEASGHPFVGKAGKNLSAFLDTAHINRNDIYITNAVKFRPVKINPKTNRASNRTPTTDEIISYREWLLKELSVINPKLVVTLGNTPLFSVTGDKKLKISAVHGTISDYQNSLYSLNFKLMPFYHPAAIIYRRELVVEYQNDMIKFAESVKNIL